MKRIIHPTIDTAHGIATFYKRGKTYHYDITLDDKKIPADKRRIRKSLGYVSDVFFNLLSSNTNDQMDSLAQEYEI